MEFFNLRTSTSLFLYALFFLTATRWSYANAYEFEVGGRSGWILHPSEPYNHWAERSRFQVNDTLYFKYDKNIDSVLVVNKDDYDHCYISKPQLKLEGGQSVFKFDRSGPFYFITSNVTNCQNGQKLIVVVLAVRHRTPPSTPATVPPTIPTVPVPFPSGHAPAPAPSATEAPPTKKNAGAAVFGPATVVFSAVCALVGLSVISI